MKGLTKEQEILRQVKLAKRSHFGVTAIKIEMEAVFQRGVTHGGLGGCPECHGQGQFSHATCRGIGYVGRVQDSWGYNSGGTPCLGCDMTGYQTCPKCFDSSPRWGSVNYCQQWLLKQMHEMGLSSRKRDGTYIPKSPLVFGMFYNDPSVDSEFTFTLSLKNEQSIFLLPRIVELWKKLGDAIGNGLSISNAGMHMAFIGEKNGLYPGIDPGDWRDCLNNMDKSMRMLMPALFFLGSDSELSRGMRFRVPRTATEKYSAIHYIRNCLEFRVFEPCYDNPDRILDNFVVMRNCLRFWSPKFKLPSITKIANRINFGNDSNPNLERLYTSARHIDLLNVGILKLKPKYKTIAELKAERSFVKTKNTFTELTKRLKLETKARYPRYKKSQEWSAAVSKQNVITNYLETRSVPMTASEVAQYMLQAEERGNAMQNREMTEILNEDAYIEREVKRSLESNEGQYTLAV